MRLEPREHASPLLTAAAIALAVVSSFAIGSIAIAWGGKNPIDAYVAIYRGAVGSQFAFTETLLRTVPLIFTGLAAAVAFKAKLWNIGGEGQFYAGGLAVAILGAGLLPVPSPVLVPVLLLAGAVAGALLLLGPTLLKTKLGVDEVVTTLLLNFIFLLFISMLLDGILKDPAAAGWPKSARILTDANLPRLIPRSRLHWGLVLAVATAVIVWVVTARTKWGFAMVAAGSNPTGARFLGVPVNATFLFVALLSGGLAGLGGAVEIMGVRNALTNDLSPGFGFTGIIVATLANLNPLAVVPAALFVAGIFVGADEMSRTVGLPSFIAQVITAVSLLCTLAALLIIRYRIRV